MADLSPSVPDDLPLKRSIEDVNALDEGKSEAHHEKREKEESGEQVNPSDPVLAGKEDAAGADSAQMDVCEDQGDADRFTVVVAFKKQKLEIKVLSTDLVSTIKAKLEDLTGVAKENQKLMFKGMLADTSTVADAGLKEGTKLMLIGTPTQEIRMEQLAAVVAHAIEPTAVAVAAQKSRLQDLEEHKKIITKGVPPGAEKGLSGRKMRLFECNNVINNLYDKRGEAVRLTFKLEENQIWIGAKTRTTKLGLDQIRNVTWEAISGFDGYCVLILQAGPTDKSNMFFYFVPAQYCDDIRRCIMS